MNRPSRWPIAAALGLGLAGGFFATNNLTGQAPADPPPVPRELASFSGIVKRVVPAVVSIEGKTAPARVAPGRGRPRADLPPGVPEEFRPFFGRGVDEGGQEAVPNVGFGSGVVIDPNGVVLTNNHVVEGADSVEVQLTDGRKFTTRDIRRDPKTDLAVVRFKADVPLPFLELGDSDAIEVGDRVLAVGAPFGLTGSVTHGIVSAKSRNNLRLNQYEDFLQTDAAINPGNSGGPLISLDGRVIGINSAIKTRSGGFQGVGLAISSNLARTVSQALLRDGVVRRGYLGVGVRDVDADLGGRLGVPADGGVVITRVFEGAPAEKAGVQVGDVITSVAGRQVKNGADLRRAVVALTIGQPTDVTLVREGQPLAVKLTVEEQPEEFGTTARVPTRPLIRRAPVAVPVEDLGLAMTDLTPDLSAQLGFPDGIRGALVLAVAANGRADAAGVVRGSVVVKVDKTPVASVKEFRAAVDAADKDRGALLQVMRPSGEVDFVVLKLKD